MRTYFLLRGVAERHSVDLFGTYYGSTPEVGPLDDICQRVAPLALGPSYTPSAQLRDLFRRRPRAVAYFTPAPGHAALRQALQPPYDLIICDEIMVTPYLNTIVQMHREAGHAKPPALLLRPKIDHIHYREMASERAWGKAKLLDLLESQRLHTYELTILNRYRHAVVCSQEDQAITEVQAPKLPVDIVANGADTTYFHPQRHPDPKPTLLLMGTMYYYPNIDGVQYFFEAIYTRLREQLNELQVLIVGHKPPHAIQQLGELPGVTVTGSVDDVRPYIARSWAMAVPLRLGGGTRLKIAEAFAAGLPVVSTSIGAEGLDVVNGEHLLLADSPEQFSKALLRVLRSPDLADSLATAGRALAVEKYSWQSLGRRFSEICEAVAMK